MSLCRSEVLLTIKKGIILLEASLQEIKKAYLQNAKAAGVLQGAHTASQGMLLFYSSECGLKYLVMLSRGEKTTRKVAAEFGHDLRRLVLEARIAPRELGIKASSKIELPTVRRQSNENQISFSELHAAWRYGVALEKNASDALSFLNTLTSALRMRITA